MALLLFLLLIQPLNDLAFKRISFALQFFKPILHPRPPKSLSAVG